jgi:hypothetical protein
MLLILARRNLPRYQARSMMPCVRRGLTDADRSMVELAHDLRSLRWSAWLAVGVSTRCSDSRGSSRALCS